MIVNSFIDDFNDWCISENAQWGIPIPFFIYKDTSKLGN
jgi:isoleucyl-tRNA synthetase